MSRYPNLSPSPNADLKFQTLAIPTTAPYLIFVDLGPASRLFSISKERPYKQKSHSLSHITPINRPTYHRHHCVALPRAFNCKAFHCVRQEDSPNFSFSSVFASSKGIWKIRWSWTRVLESVE
ncbi:hypothetical protein GALMADRAFT_145537 [Galerina marginata CBS 339.88]|uniref:Uncharacterized protein n=1 Tax=Galerina marginata (strain CBS 339.88) TaxID=685588 RepID=A0A067SF03_GALM3|nr:hypothetical protein GALMADRAFT_145537 [Galerina marginata CBS 339.88]